MFLIPFLYEAALNKSKGVFGLKVMGLRFQVEIKESLEKLEKAVKYAKTASNKERLQILQLYNLTKAHFIQSSILTVQKILYRFVSRLTLQN